jgi:hypothetical protein
MDPVSPKRLRHLPVDLIEMEIAFDNSSTDMSYYLDLETGHVVLVTAEARRAIETEPHSGDEVDECPASVQDAVDDARQVADGDERFVAIPSQRARGNLSDIQEFIGTVANESLRERLWDAIQGHGAFDRFREILARYPEERERWFEFEQDCTMQRIMDWLADEGIEPVVEYDSGEAAPAADNGPGTGC